MMKLRWFQTCNKDGVWSTPSLQVWSVDDLEWIDVPLTTCKTWEEEKYLHDEFL